jgi:hypothetical protein
MLTSISDPANILTLPVANRDPSHLHSISVIPQDFPSSWEHIRSRSHVFQLRTIPRTTRPPSKMPAKRRDYDSEDEDIVVEDLSDEEDYASHDQLPSADECKANRVHRSRRIPTTIIFIIFGIATVIALSITGVVVAKNNKSGSESTPTNLAGRTKSIEEFLFNNQISTLPQLREFGSAPHLATAFVADGDMLHLKFPETNASAKRFVERYVLALLYYQFNGHLWTFNLRFLSGVDHCEWNADFETSTGNVVRQGVICNEDGHVIELNLGKLFFLDTPTTSATLAQINYNILTIPAFVYALKPGTTSKELISQRKYNTWKNCKTFICITIRSEDISLRGFAR